MSPSILRNHFQNGYIVRKMSCAQSLFEMQYGVTSWHVLKMSADSPVLAIAKAYLGRVMVELIEPNPDMDTIYSRFLPDSDTSARFHHFGYQVETDDEFRRIVNAFAAQGIATAFSGSHGEILDFHFVDTVAQLGHYCEFIHLKPAGKNFYADVPRC